MFVSSACPPTSKEINIHSDAKNIIKILETISNLVIETTHDSKLTIPSLYI